ncbi:hypothetical protein HF521_008668 [Silurus meridionalis]|uniref:Uncharacterized protein n=1 Tax=Silurus meridionalis TaxID=175797 RepID=A0A8T0AKV0_SILME|nr:hypothetical protein HF521_008668 [Silurus meridionalis]
MASASQKRKIDSLNAFIHQRLNNIAGEICQVFQETLAAYQEEINQSKQENVHLRNMLAEFTLHRTDRIDAQTSQADGFPPEKQNLSQASMDPEASVIQVKLELSTTQQDLELPKQSCPTLACSPAASDRDKDTSPDREISGPSMPSSLCRGASDCESSFIEEREPGWSTDTLKLRRLTL